jgi:5-amino-6-(5-phosphoribosylamino)uracil reductase
VQLRRLLPEPGTVTPAEAVAGLAGRTTLVVNMVTSADGRAALDGRTKALSDDADREVFHALRAQADAILVGTGTLRAERYGLFTKPGPWMDLRAAAGLEPEPLGIVMTRSLDLPLDIPLFQDPAARIAVYTTADGDLPATPAHVELTRMEALDPPAVLERVRADHGVRCVLCEGGPTLNGSLFATGVVDELFLSISPLLAGGTNPLTIVEGEAPDAAGLELVQAIEHAGTLLLRYRVARRG